jgi:hypothetical protein
MTNIPAVPITVVLSAVGFEELGDILKFFITQSPMLGHYVRCKSVNSQGQYFQMVLVQAKGAEYVDVDFNIPHHFVKCFLQGPDPKEFGFTRKA